MPRLKVIHRDQSRTEYEFGEQVITIGREADNLVAIEDAAISRHHAVVEMIDGEWWLRDLGSSNGTIHEGQRIQSLRLIDRSSFEMGGLKFRFSLAAHEASLPARPEIGQAKSGRGTRSGTKGKGKTPKLPQRLEEDTEDHAARTQAGATEPPGPTGKEPAAPSPELAPARDDRSPKQIAPAGDTIQVYRDDTAMARTLPPPPGRPWYRWAALLLIFASLGAAWGILGMNSSKLTQDEKEIPVQASLRSPVPQNVVPGARTESVTAAPIAMREPEPAASPLPVPVVVKEDARPRDEFPKQMLRYQPGHDHAGFQPVIAPRLDMVLHVKKTSKPASSGGFVDVFLNDKMLLSDVKIISEGQMRFSEDGTNWAVQAADRQGERFIAIRDQKMIRIDGEIIQWLGNRDFSHIAVVTRKNGEDTLCIDGLQVSSYHQMRDLQLSQDGLKWAYVAAKPADDGSGATAGERVVSQDGPQEICERVSSLVMAPDGGRIAWVAEHPSGKRKVMTGGKCVYESAAERKDRIQSLAISQTGGRLAWIVVPAEGHPVLHLADGKHWPLTVAREVQRASPPATQVVPATRIMFSEVHERFVAAATSQDSVVLLEGEEARRHPWLSLESLVLSDDGSRSAYVVYRPDEEAHSGAAQRHVAELWVDGRRTGTQALAWLRGMGGGGPAVFLGGITGTCFSPGGGKHVACLRLAAAQSGEGGVRQAWIDDAVAPVPHQDAAQVAWLNSEDIAWLDMRSSDSSTWHIIHHLPKMDKK